MLFSHPVMCNSLLPHGLRAAHQASLTTSQSLPKFMSIASVMPSSHLTLWCPHLSIFPSIRDFSNVSVFHIRWPKYWSFSFSISPSTEYSRLISLKIDWFDLLAVPGILRSLLQHHISKASNSVIFNKDSGGLHVDFLSSVSAKSSPFRNPTLLSQSPWPLWSSNSVSMTQ